MILEIKIRVATKIQKNFLEELKLILIQYTLLPNNRKIKKHQK